MDFVTFQLAPLLHKQLTFMSSPYCPVEKSLSCQTMALCFPFFAGLCFLYYIWFIILLNCGYLYIASVKHYQTRVEETSLLHIRPVSNWWHWNCHLHHYCC